MKQVSFTLALFTAFLLQAATCMAQDQPNADAVSLATQSRPMTIVLDAREAPRGIMQSHMTIPAKPGTFTIVYPKWIPGEHGPTGPLHDLTQLRVSSGGRDLAWRRDKVDMYAFHVDVPQGTDSISVDFTVLLNAPGDTMSTHNIAVVNWHRDLLYQSNINSQQYFVKSSIMLPHGWGYGTALPGARQSGDRVDFDTATLYTVIDSPLDMGRFYKHVLLWQNGNAAQWLDVFADKPQDLDFPAKEVAAYKRMTPQGLALYGSRHWTQYHSLLTLSDAIEFQGIEHHQSSDNRAPENFMTDPKAQLAEGDLLTHEFSHSWNGKYRRPDDLTTPNFQIPQQTDLLWVYEGMNQYLGDVLSFRTNIRDPKTYPDYLASIYAEMDTEPGRMTTPIIDTTTGAPYYYVSEGEYPSLRRRASDFYVEGHLIWLAADIIIRDRTAGRKSLDDFEHLFTQPAITAPVVKTYTRADVENLLNEVTPYDWHGFFDRYVYSISPHPPYDDIERAGWRLIYNDKPNAYLGGRDAKDRGMNLWYSLGIKVNGEGVVRDVRQGSAAWNAGLAPGVKIVAVNDEQFDNDTLEYVVKSAQHSSSAIRLLGSLNGWYGTYAVNYHDGMRYPHLVRINTRPDMLGKIVSARE